MEKAVPQPCGAPFPSDRTELDADGLHKRPQPPGRSPEEDDALPEPRPLTAAEAQALGLRLGSVTAWRVLRLQGLAGCGVAAVAGAWAGEQAFWSALWGAAVIVVPGVVMVRGLRRRPAGAPASAGVVSFLLWEFVKIALSVALLLLAVKVVQPLNWLALLAGLVVCAKVYWVPLLSGLRRSRGS